MTVEFDEGQAGYLKLSNNLPPLGEATEPYLGCGWVLLPIKKAAQVLAFEPGLLAQWKSELVHDARVISQVARTILEVQTRRRK